METVTTLKEETLEKVQDLIEINIDSVKGFVAAKDAIDEPRVSQLFANLAETRADFANELKSFVHLNREEPEDSGSFAGGIHRMWLKFRNAINGGDVKVVLIEAERGEDAIKEKYEDVLEETAGSPLNGVLTRQYAKVKKGHDLVRDLRDHYLED